MLLSNLLVKRKVSTKAASQSSRYSKYRLLQHRIIFLKRWSWMLLNLKSEIHFMYPTFQLQVTSLSKTKKTKHLLQLLLNKKRKNLKMKKRAEKTKSLKKVKNQLTLLKNQKKSNDLNNRRWATIAFFSVV